ncbi:MAG TPA: DinB family protein [Candidatus Acidoferrales bacterium]|nr:DinB family protein [Candidatus Acidoferrales bacterium]
MKLELIGRPDDSEFPPYAKIYVDLVTSPDIFSALAAQINSTLAMLEPIADGFASTRAYAPGKWTIKQVVGHVIDTERIFSYRSLCIARNEQAPLPGYEQDDYVQFGGANERLWAEILDELRIVRRSTMALFGGMPREAWLRRGTANQASVTVRGLAYLIAGHELHHARVLRERYLG